LASLFVAESGLSSFHEVTAASSPLKLTWVRRNSSSKKKGPNFFVDYTEEKRDTSRTDIINSGAAKLNTL
jgi:hypothetical protein